MRRFMHGLCRQVVGLLRDLFGVSLSIGTIHAWVVQAARRAGAINRAQALSSVRVGLHDEIFQGDRPVLTGIDAAANVLARPAKGSASRREALELAMSAAKSRGEGCGLSARRSHSGATRHSIGFSRCAACTA